jgi:hypothetical protein
MPSRLASLTVPVALLALASCAAPRTAIVAGGVSAVTGALVFHDAFTPTEAPFVGLLKAGVEGTAGVALLTAGAGLIIAGLVGLGQEEHAAPAPPPLGPLAREPMAPAAMEASFAPPGSATAVLAARTDQLTTQLQLEARAGHCEAATAIARRLAVLDRARTVALIEGDAAVGSCVGYRI